MRSTITSIWNKFFNYDLFNVLRHFYIHHQKLHINCTLLQPIVECVLIKAEFYKLYITFHKWQGFVNPIRYN